MVIAKFFLGGAVKSDAPSNETVTADGRASPGAAAPLRITHTAHTPFTRGLRAPPSWSEVQRRHRLRDFVGAARGRDEAPRSQPQRVEPLVRAVEPGLRSHGASRPPRFSFARSLKNARGAGRCRSRRATDADRPLAGCDVGSDASPLKEPKPVRTSARRGWGCSDAQAVHRPSKSDGTSASARKQ